MLQTDKHTLNHHIYHPDHIITILLKQLNLVKLFNDYSWSLFLTCHPVDRLEQSTTDDDRVMMIRFSRLDKIQEVKRSHHHSSHVVVQAPVGVVLHHLDKYLSLPYCSTYLVVA